MSCGPDTLTDIVRAGPDRSGQRTTCSHPISQDPTAEGDDEPGLLRQRDEAVGGHEA
jgi:hypothetical protein